MHSNIVNPIFVFLPVHSDPGPEEVRVDPVCGRAIERDAIAGRLLHAGRHHYFCSLPCAESFASDPAEYVGR